MERFTLKEGDSTERDDGNLEELARVSSRLHGPVVAVCKQGGTPSYPSRSPYPPPQIYPEYQFPQSSVTDENNKVYPAVREVLRLMGLDKEKFGSPDWNPIGDISRPGATIVLKVNFVKHFHPDGDEAVVNHMLTHPSVIRPVLDYVLRAVGRAGRVFIVDTPLQKADMKRIFGLLQIPEMLDFYRRQGYSVRFLDLRDERLVVDEVYNRVLSVVKLEGDPEGTVTVRLGKNSSFADLDAMDPVYHTLADNSYDHYDPLCMERGLTNLHHNRQGHEYRIGRTFLLADAVISIPKLKTHKKAGVTLNLKNMIGMVAGKDYMPHHRPGNPPLGDACPVSPPRELVHLRRNRIKIKQVMSRLPGGNSLITAIRWALRDLLKIPGPRWDYLENGDWYGNDTIWRTIIDLNKILLYCDRDGTLQPTPQRAYLSIIDGIIGHQGDGPMNGHARPCGAIIGGFAPLTVDAVAARMMGFEPAHIRQLGYHDPRFFLGDAGVDAAELQLGELDALPVFDFVPPKGWKDHIEA
jgi:uncharacterized protein (DUF362 family)